MVAGHHFLLPHAYCIIILFFILLSAPTYLCEDNEYYTQCRKPFVCGNISLSYPFWGGDRHEVCGRGGFEVRCKDNNQTSMVKAGEGGEEFFVLDVNQSSNMITIARQDFWDFTVCSRRLNTIPFEFREHLAGNVSLLYNCTESIRGKLPGFPCRPTDKEIVYFARDESLKGRSDLNADVTQCTRVNIPVINDPDQQAFQMALGGFIVSYYYDEGPVCDDCLNSDGSCGTELITYNFTCFCRDGPQPQKCPGNKMMNMRLKVIIGGVVGVIFGIVLLIIYIFKRRISTNAIMNFWQSKGNDKDLEAFITEYGPLPVKGYNYSEVKKITNLFKDRLGEGGYGSVYKGMLCDGRLVAVKLLKESKGNGQEFINEVASISRTSHVNIVTLLGFCVKGQIRVLIYELMPNGSLDKFINIDEFDTHLGWNQLYKIAIGVARGLEYLHRGCNTKIVHFDIKPHNILLDEDFYPKISDFGLAKLCTQKESILSMSEARGTIGYIAPEVFNRNFGEVSHKSDVYSYGMMVLEMVGQRNKNCVETDRSSELYFPHWIYKHLEHGSNFEFPGTTTMEEVETTKKMTLVGLWCIQTNPFDRPSINEVIEMLERSLEALKIPPKPFLSSPKKSLSYSSTKSMTT